MNRYTRPLHRAHARPTCLLAMTTLILAVGQPAPAQPTLSEAKGIDVHVVFVQLAGRRGSGWSDIPIVAGDAVRRFELQADGRNFQQTAIKGGSASILKKLALKRRRDSGRITLDWNVRAGTFSMGMGGLQLDHDATGEVVTLLDGRMYGRRSTRGRRGAGSHHLLFVPHGEEAPELRVWSAEDYATWVAKLAMSSKRLHGDLSKLLGRLPLQSLLEAPDLVGLRRWVDRWDPDGSGYHPRAHTQAYSFMQPADIKIGIQLAAGDPAGLDAIQGRANIWTLSSAIALGYLQSNDPEIKGAIGWLLADPDAGNRDLHRRSMIVPYFEAAEAGDLVIPGTEEQRAERYAHLSRLAAETDATGSLFVIIGAAAALFGVAVASRRLALKLAV